MVIPFVSLSVLALFASPRPVGEGAASAFGASTPRLETRAGEGFGGIWKGTVRGAGLFVPREGVPLTLWVDESPGSVSVELAVQGFDLQRLQGRIEDGGGALNFQAAAPNGVPIRYELTRREEACEGAARGSGFELSLELRRTSEDVRSELPPPSAPAPPRSLSREDWLEDLDALGEHLPKVHLDAFHTIDEDAWIESIEALKERVDELAGPRLVIAMARVVARIGDAHTGLHWRESGGFTSFPVQVMLFEDGVHVVAVDERFGEALCARVTGIGGHPI